MRPATTNRHDAASTLPAPRHVVPRLDADALRECVEAGTYRQIYDLDVNYFGDRIRVTGQSRTFYAKQLATQAILALLPGASLENEICVSFN